MFKDLVVNFGQWGFHSTRDICSFGLFVCFCCSLALSLELEFSSCQNPALGGLNIRKARGPSSINKIWNL